MTLAKIIHISLPIVALFIGIAAYGQPYSDSLQTTTATNLQYADSFVYQTNAGTTTTPPNGNICANDYVVASGTLISCCACLITPQGLTSLSVIDDLHSAPNSSVTIKALVSTPATPTPHCDPTTPTLTNSSTGLRSWIVTFATPNPAGGTENVFQQSTPTTSDLSSTVAACKAFETGGSTPFTNAQGCLCFTTPLV